MARRPGRPADVHLASWALPSRRGPAIWGIGRSADGSNPWAKIEPRLSANLSNQFEWPLLFCAACLVLLPSAADPAALVLAWVFVAGRVLHSLVQVLTGDVRLCGLVFTVNFLAVPALWAIIAAAQFR